MTAQAAIFDEIKSWFAKEQVGYTEVFERINKFNYDMLINSDIYVRKTALLLLFVLFDVLHQKTRLAKKGPLEAEVIELKGPFYSKDKAVYLVVNNELPKIDEFNAYISDLLLTQKHSFDRNILSYVVQSGSRTMLLGIDSRSALKFAKDQWVDATPDPIDRICFLSKTLLADRTGLPFELKLNYRPIKKKQVKENLKKNDIAGLLTVGFIKALKSFSDDSKFNEREIYKTSYQPVSPPQNTSTIEKKQLTVTTAAPKSSMFSFVGTLPAENSSTKPSRTSQSPSKFINSSSPKTVSFKFSQSPNRSGKGNSGSSLKNSTRNFSIRNIPENSPKPRTKNKASTMNDLGCQTIEEFSFNKPALSPNLKITATISPTNEERRSISPQSRMKAGKNTNVKPVSSNFIHIPRLNSPSNQTSTTKRGLFMIKRKEIPPKQTLQFKQTN